MKPYLAAAFALTFTHNAIAAEKQLWAKSIIDQKAPELTVEKWLTDKPATEGKFVLIDFWATWCPPCREAIAELNSFQKEYKDKLVVIGISDETEDKVSKFKSPKIEYSLAIDTQARTKKLLEVSGIPHVIIIDPKGIVRWEGFPFLEGHELKDSVLKDLFAKYGDANAKPDSATQPATAPETKKEDDGKPKPESVVHLDKAAENLAK